MAYPEPNSLDDIYGPGAEDAESFAEYDEDEFEQCAECGHSWPVSIVFVDLPALDERREIFAVHLRKRGREPEEFNLDELAETTEGYSGAEIEASVKAGLLRAFMDGERWVMTDDIVECARRIQPTSVIKRGQVESLRNWAKDHLAVSAGGSGVTPINDLMQGARALEM